jgi:N-acetylglutamate synthase-like GNAT family acetyltransferase
MVNIASEPSGKLVSCGGFSAATNEMNDVSVLPEYRHYGYGKKLLYFCKTKVKKLGVVKMVYFLKKNVHIVFLID